MRYCPGNPVQVSQQVSQYLRYCLLGGGKNSPSHQGLSLCRHSFLWFIRQEKQKFCPGSDLLNLQYSQISVGSILIIMYLSFVLSIYDI